MAVIGSMSVNLMAATDRFIKGIRAAQESLAGFMGKATALSAGLSASMGVMLHSFESTGSEIHDLATRTGMTAENLSALKYAAQQSSTSIESLTAAFTFMQKHGMDPNTFSSVAASIAAIENPTLRAHEAIKVFGKRGAELLPMIMELPSLTAEFQKLGGTITSEMAKNADALGDSFGKVALALSAVKNHIANDLAPAVTQMNEFLATNGEYVINWIDNHRTLISVAGGAVVILTTLTPAVWAYNQACIALTTTLGALKVAASVPVVAKLLRMIGGAGGLAIAGGVISGAGAGYELYKMSKQEYGGGAGASGSWDADVKNNTKQQVDQQKETNSLLQQMVRGGQPQLRVAGMR